MTDDKMPPLPPEFAEWCAANLTPGQIENIEDAAQRGESVSLRIWQGASQHAAALAARVATLELDAAICRDAIEDAVNLVSEWEDERGDDTSAGAARATRRKLSEAIGKAVPRLMYESPAGQKLYGLRYRELHARVAELERRLESGVELMGQLVACHDEPTCPAVSLAQEWIDAAMKDKP